MSKLVINDLPENKELDKQAMRSIVGGRHTGLRSRQALRSNYFSHKRRLFR